MSMTKEERVAKAFELKHKGFNCAQAVAMAFQDLTGMDGEILAALNQGFGSGMGTMGGTCGALTGGCTALSLAAHEMKTRPKVKVLFQSFEKACGATICKDLKGIETGKTLSSCDDCVKHAAAGVAEALGIE